MTAFSIALVLSYFYRGVEFPLYFMAISIAVSRVVLGMHFLKEPDPARRLIAAAAIVLGIVGLARG